MSLCEQRNENSEQCVLHFHDTVHLTLQTCKHDSFFYNLKALTLWFPRLSVSLLTPTDNCSNPSMRIYHGVLYLSTCVLLFQTGLSEGVGFALNLCSHIALRHAWRLICDVWQYIFTAYTTEFYHFQTWGKCRDTGSWFICSN